MRKRLKLIIFTLFITGCSGYGGEWPKLNDPLPDPKDRDRIHITSDIEVAPYEQIEYEAITLVEHKSRHTVIIADIEEAWQDFDTKINSITIETDPEDKIIAWSGSQLSLSRVSAEINNLRNLMEQPIIETSENSDLYIESLKTHLTTNDRRLITAKGNIAALKPE
jgi:hypothetical protein